ncbi:TRAP transporter substrate-binding protein [Amylibacter sp. IMCC11727]|uniref:TRAP transporter substrate-binding protein n=1 Tax=Amylibacter sp. IMCC11727 TaxID=3039851 RepID=UPI00244DCABE|nr:TRAP transporter substrate-binding protein [Amylibacter sp. IMCC11727]WGI22275.1 TRAP transporter substrate-binding protein [Amylibacter sp. IMCC11727]
MSKFTNFLATTAIALSASVSAYAQDTTLRISSWAPPSHGMNAFMWPKLTEMIEAATDGKVTAEIKYGLAPPPAQMDLILDGAADITWIFHGYNPGRFVGTKLIELPGYEGSAEAASVAHWRVHEKHLAALNEHRGVKLIGLMTHGPGQMHTNKEVSSLADLSGLKTRIGGGVAGDVGAELGLVGIRVPAPKVYETLDSGAADAVAMPMEARKSFKLVEVAKNLYEVPGGLYRGSFAVVMNQETFDSLPADVQEALDSKVFGEALSQMAGAVWDQIDTAGREATAAAEGNTMQVASDADLAAFNAIADKVIAKVKAELAEKGVDAEAAYSMVVEEMAK